MSKRRQAVMQRRQMLLAKIADQRVQIAEWGERWKTPLRMVDQAWVAVRFVRAHPGLAAGFASLAVLQRRGVIALAKGAWRIWKTYRIFNAAYGKITNRQ